MASPFAVFRKNQKVMMAALVLLAMVAFVFADFFDLSGRQNSMQDPVVVETNYFDLKESDIDRAIGQRQLVHQVLTRAVSTAVLQEELPRLQAQFQGLDPSFLAEQLRRREAEVVQGISTQVVRFIGSADEASVVDNLVLADMARKMGMDISNDRVEAFIFRIASGLTKERFVEILRGMPNLSLTVFYDAFRRELLAMNLRRVFAEDAASVSTPVDRWNYFQRKSLRASVEVLPVRTADLIKAGKVAEPTDRELTAYYDEYKLYEPVPGSATPGFKIPQKAAFQYFVADEAKFYAPEKITAEAIAAHYEQNKTRYRYTQEDFPEPTAPKADAAAPAAGATTPTTPAAMPTTTTTPPAATPPGATPPAAGTPAAPAPTATPAATKPVDPKPTATKPADPKPTATKTSDAKPAGDSKPAEPKPAGEKKPTAVSPDCGATEAEAADGELAPSDCADEPAKSTDAKPGDAKPSETKSGDAKPTASPSASAASAANPSATKPAAPATPAASPTATPSGTPPAAASTVAAPPAAAPALPPLPLPSEDVMLPDDVRTGKQPEFDPLWRVEDKIRKELADAAARKEVTDTFEKLRKVMNDASMKIITSDQKAAVLFTEEQWAELAKPYPGIEAKSTGVVDRIQAIAAADQPGLFHSNVAGGAMFQRGGVPFVQAEYSNSSTYTPKESSEIPEATSPLTSPAESAAKTVHYLYWKTMHDAARIPKLAEIKDRVKFAWQTEQARKLVRDEAENLAKKARETPKPLSQVFPDREVIRTNAFTWYETDLSGGFGRQTLTDISKVDGVDDPGADFMQAVFALDVGQFATAMNNPQNICYVIHVVTMDPPRDRLLRDFAIDHFETYIQFGNDDARREMQEAEDALLADADIRWLREPVEPQMFDQ